MLVHLAVGGAALSAACSAPAASPTAAPQPTSAPAPTAAPKPAAAAEAKPADKPAAAPAATTAPAPAATQAPAKTTPKEKVTIRMDFALLGYHAPFFYGKEKGYYDANGIDITIQPGQGSVAVAQQIGAKPEETQFGFIVGDAVVRSVAANAPVRMVSALLPKGSNAFIVYKASGISKLKDMEGKSLGDIPGGFTYNLVDVILDKEGVDKNKVQRVSLGVEVKNQTFLQKKVDSITGPTYVMPQLEAFANEPMALFAFTDYGISYIGHGLATNEQLIKTKPDMVKGFVKATIQAFKESKEKPEAAIEVFGKQFPEAVKGGGGDKAQLEQLRQALALTETASMKGQPFGFQTEDDWKQTVDLVAKYGGLQGPVPAISQLYTNDMLPK